MKRYMIIIMLLLLMPFSVKAATKTYNICKEGCEYDSILVVWHDIYKLTEDVDVVINFKDDGAYTFFDMNHFDVLMDMDEDEQAAHITNPHVKSVVINGDKTNNTTIDVINIPDDYIRNAIIDSDVFSDEGTNKFIENLVLYDLELEKEAKIMEIYNSADEDAWKQIKGYKNTLKNMDLLDKTLIVRYGDNFTYEDIINSLDTYDENIPYMRFLTDLIYELNRIGYYYENVCTEKISNFNWILIDSDECNQVRDVYDQLRIINNSIYESIENKVENVDFNQEVDMDALMAAKKQEILDGSNGLIETAFSVYYSSSANKALTANENYAFLTIKDVVENLEYHLDESKSMMLRVMFTGIVNTDFEINNITYIGSPYFASSGDKVTGTMNNCNMPYLLLVGGNVDVYVRNSKVNRIYSVGVEDFEGDLLCEEVGDCFTLPYVCDGTNLCGNSNVYLNKTDKFYNEFKRFDLGMIERYYDELMELLEENSEEVSVDDVEPDFVRYVNGFHGDFTGKSDADGCDYDYCGYVLNEKIIIYRNYCYDTEKGKYYLFYSDDSEQVMNIYVGIFESFKDYFRDSLMAELSGGKIYYEAEEEINILVKDKMSLRDIFNSKDVDFDKIEWHIEDESIAKIVDGKVLGVKKGTTTITATYGRDIYTLVVNVENVPVSPNTVAFGILSIVVIAILSGFTYKFLKRNKMNLIK